MVIPSSAFPARWKWHHSWENGQSGETIKVSVHNGHYEVFLGGQGMNSCSGTVS